MTEIKSKELDGIPCRVLGLNVKTKTFIYLSGLTPSILELIVYLVVTLADIGVIIQHFRDENILFGVLTLIILCLPAWACFCSIIVSPLQWPNQNQKCNKVNYLFFQKQLLNLVFFPFAAIYRLCRKIFWLIEALCYAKDCAARKYALSKANETTPFELYHFLQAFLQAAPQIILQFYIILREDMFRNYETSHVQIISILSAFITMAIVTSSYQRFESQKTVGRNYPWTSVTQAQLRNKKFADTKCYRRKTKSEPTYIELPHSEHIMERFKTINENDAVQSSRSVIENKSMHLGNFNLMQENDLTLANEEQKFDWKNATLDLNIPIDNEDPDSITSTNLDAILEANEEILHIDASPDYPPPPPPPPSNAASFVLNRFSIFKDMLVLNASIYIQDNVPRLPSSMFKNDKETDETPMPSNGNDEIDFMLPTRKKTIEGIEQEDFIGKSVAFTAWIFFLFMRMLSISVFAVFFPMECVYLCAAHYILMVCCLFLETKFHEKIERTMFYLFLAYIYIFCIIEFKVKFKRPRYWYIGFINLTLIQNLTITIVWYTSVEYESWWFDYMFVMIVLSLFYSIVCLLVYYFFLRPAEKILVSDIN